jgi:hypothetical protein
MPRRPDGQRGWFLVVVSLSVLVAACSDSKTTTKAAAGSTAVKSPSTAAVSGVPSEPPDVTITAAADGSDTTLSANDATVAGTIDTSGPDGQQAITTDTIVIQLGSDPATPATTGAGGSTSTGGVPTSAGTNSASDTTLPNKGAAVVVLVDGGTVPDPVSASAQRIYAAAIHHDYVQLRDILGDRKFRYGRLGEGNTVQHWQDAVAAGERDPLAAVVKLFEFPAGKSERGEIVWPYVAVKDPKTWNADDEKVLAELGFSAEQIEATKQKGRYYDERLTFSADGTWTGFAIGA